MQTQNVVVWTSPWTSTFHISFHKQWASFGLLENCIIKNCVYFPTWCTFHIQWRNTKQKKKNYGLAFLSLCFPLFFQQFSSLCVFFFYYYLIFSHLFSVFHLNCMVRSQSLSLALSLLDSIYSYLFLWHSWISAQYIHVICIYLYMSVDIWISMCVWLCDCGCYCMCVETNSGNFMLHI